MTQPTTPIPTLKPQEIPFDHPDSTCMFLPGLSRPFVATRAAMELYGPLTIFGCLDELRRLAQEHQGLDYLQVFTDASKPEPLWFIEDGAGGAITALLPSDY
jgi:hypothetical protein